MIYGDALLTGIPWETIIKSFRQRLDTQRYKTVSEYATALIKYVEDTDVLFSEEQEEGEFKLHCLELYGYLRRQIEDRLHTLLEERGKATETDISEATLAVFREERHKIEENNVLENLPEGYGEILVERFSDAAELAMLQVFEKLPLSAEASSLLRSLTVAWLHSPLEAIKSKTGLVVAGFGESEFMPALVEFHVYGVMGGVLRRRPNGERNVTDHNHALVLPFAQREMVDLFMSGVDPQLREAYTSVLRTIATSLPVHLAKLASMTSNGVSEHFGSIGQELFERYNDELTGHIQDHHVLPILDAVSALPIGELGVMAETLVNLTSFKRRVTLDAETVGGPIDTAVISKGDGLVWIRRKHYFDPKLNHHFFANYFDNSLSGEDQL